MVISRFLTIFLFGLVVMPGQLQAQSSDFKEQTTFHTDGRTTPRLDFVTPDAIQKNMIVLPLVSPTVEKTDKTMYSQVIQFLGANAKRYGLSENAVELKLIEEQESLLGNHFRFQQTLGGLNVITGEIVVSVDKGGNIKRVSNNIFPAEASAIANKSAVAKISNDRAYDIVWKDLNVEEGARLLEPYSADLKYWPSSGGFKLVYDIKIAVNKPFGYWHFLVDADSGEIIKKQERTSNLGDYSKHNEAKKGIGPVANRQELFREIELKAAQNFLTEFTKSEVTTMKVTSSDGKALVFDPDPLTTLQSTTLRDDSPPSAFDSAYFERPLKGLKVENGTFHLVGPWVRLMDFEEPKGQPSTTIDGNWTARRGDNAFNDAMTYYHIDMAQRYIQSLGFTNVIAWPIEVDADGVDGADNSHHIPDRITGRAGRLAFGHGCVDDNEDADVIWHEYGHAVHADIVGKNWSGGDSGAMGEGFGDYLAATLSIRKENGNTFQTNKVFNWDGIGTCWSGRTVKLIGVKYNPSRFYDAHQPIENDAASDELWSSPLFQAQLTLIAAGKHPEDGDKIVIESMFGLTSSGAKMHDLAQLTVLAAQTLFPGDIHAATFLKNFQDYNICHPDNPIICAIPD